MRFIPAVLLALVFVTAHAQTQEPAREGTAKKTVAFEDRILGGFRLSKDGVGFLVLEGKVLVEVLVIHREFVEPGIFLLDTESDRACSLDEPFAARLKFEAGGTISLKFGQEVSIPDIAPDVGECVPLRKYESGEENGVKGTLLKIPFRMKPAALSCDVAINVDRRAIFQISTACPASWVNRDVAAEARWRKGKKPTSFQVAGVEMCDVPVTFLFKNFEGKDQAAPVVDGVLGNDFLSNFIVTLDTAGGRILLRPIPPRPAPQTPGG